MFALRERRVHVTQVRPLAFLSRHFQAGPFFPTALDANRDLGSSCAGSLPSWPGRCTSAGCDW